MTLRRPRGHDKNKSGTMELGFVEKVRDPSELSSAFFPSKVGGKPEWLDLQNLPSPETLSCGHCKSPLVFLLQVYAPLSDGDDSTFHRTIFIFLCKDPKCHEQSGSRCFRVLRCQLPEVNDFYRPSTGDNKPVTDPADQLERLQLNKTSSDDSAAPERDLSSHLFIDSGSSSTTDEMRAKSDLNSGATSSAAEPLNQLPPPPPLCVVCGVAGPKSCAKCKQAAYCSREHQIHDWKSGHKLFCADLAKGKSCCTDYDPSVGVTLPLFEIVTEPEPDVSSLEGQQERSVEERMADYHKYVSTQKLSECDVKKEPSHKESVKEKKSDKQFRAFKKRIALEPEQVKTVCMFSF